MLTSSFRLLVASIRSRFAASSANFTAPHLNQSAHGATERQLATLTKANYHIVVSRGHRPSAVLRWGATNQQWRCELGTTHRQATFLAGARHGSDYDRRRLWQ